MVGADLWLREVIGCKTRDLRPHEQDWVDFHHYTNEQFEEAKARGDFLEYALIHKAFWYGTRKKDIIEKLEAGENIIKDIDIQWVISIANEHPDIWERTSSIFLDIPDEEMIKRITLRAAISDEEIKNRLDSAVRERELAQQYCTDIVDASGTREEVFARVYTLIKWYLEKE